MNPFKWNPLRGSTPPVAPSGGARRAPEARLAGEMVENHSQNTSYFPEIVAENTQHLGVLLAERGLEPIEASDGVLLVTGPREFYGKEPGVKLDHDLVNEPIFGELGSTRNAYNEFARDEYNAEFRGYIGLEKYDKMRRGDAATRSALNILKTPIIGATWFVEPAEETKRHRDIALFVENVFTHWMTYSWDMVLKEALNFLDFGFFPFEKVWDFHEQGTKRHVIYKKLASRHPMHVIDDDGFEYDSNGGPLGINLYNYPGQPGHVYIPINKLLVFTNDLEGGDLRGTSVLRSSYKHWFFKEQAYKIDGIQKERHGIGIPIIKLPPGFTPNDRKLAHEIGRNLRTNERAHVVLPPNWDIVFAKLEGRPVSALETADHHTRMIYQNVLAQGLWVAGSKDIDTETVMELFYKSTRQIANTVRGIINRFLIPDLVAANWDVDYFPELKVRRLGDTNEARVLSFALRNLVGAEIIQVDDRLERWAREFIDAPGHDPSTKRELKALMNKGGFGMPNQSPAGSQKPGAGGTNTGTDGNGTSGGA